MMKRMRPYAGVLTVKYAVRPSRLNVGGSS